MNDKVSSCKSSLTWPNNLKPSKPGTLHLTHLNVTTLNEQITSIKPKKSFIHDYRIILKMKITRH